MPKGNSVKQTDETDIANLVAKVKEEIVGGKPCEH